MIRIRIPDPVYIYGSGIRIQIQGNDMDSTDPDSPHWCGVEDPYFFDRAGSKLFSSDPGSGSEKGLVRNQIKSRILYPYPNLSFKSARQQQNTTIYLRLRSENLIKVPV